MTVLSVIIPVFNAEIHLKRCIDSIVSQTLNDCEFIFINDGSTDKSQSIVEAFQKKDDRIILINQQNQGVSAARNAGLQIAKGNYIGFVDADDTIEPSMFETLVEIAQKNNVDIVASRYILHQKTKQTISSDFFSRSRILESDDIKSKVIPFLIQTENLNAIWTKIFKRELIQNNQIVFPIGVALGEDGVFNLQAFHHAQSVYFTDFAGYRYFEVEGSATRNFASTAYFKTILHEYQRNDSQYKNAHLTLEKIAELKAEKCITKTISLLHEYANPKNKLRFKTAYSSISKIVNDTIFVQLLQNNYKQITAKKATYEKFILRAAKNKWISLLFIAMAYSRYKNNKIKL